MNKKTNPNDFKKQMKLNKFKEAYKRLKVFYGSECCRCGRHYTDDDIDTNWLCLFLTDGTRYVLCPKCDKNMRGSVVVK